MRKSAIFSILFVCIIFTALPAPGGDIHRAIEANDAALVREILKANPAAVNERDEGHRSKNLPQERRRTVRVNEQFESVRMAAPENRGNSYMHNKGKLDDPGK